ncbi:B12-binding domain-containing radical SAM protein [Paenibacillus tengchongensis]|uniref:B12-binding domain-containing radical SAM protein n=1 Tax=Paenibacillus tengchongensis TaxID=2608684 RepID=UPI0016524FB7|nr:radical SAM protein [Paenibacillus tengchongensis]
MLKTALIYPPISDPTSGYHSLCALAAFAQQFGFEDIDIIDSNIESWLHTTSPEQIAATMSAIENRLEILKKLDNPSAIEQMELYYALKVQGIDFLAELPSAISTLRSEADFFDYSKYTVAVETLLLWMDALSLHAFPGQFKGFSLNTHGFYNLFSSADISDQAITERISQPFSSYFKDVLIPQIRHNNYALVGISITYIAQMPFALSMARHIRTSLPEVRLIFGGTAVSDFWKYILDKAQFQVIFESADACIIGEGESAFVAVLDALNHDAPLPSTANIVLISGNFAHPSGSLPEIRYENICSLPVPDYSKLPWDQYLSPFPFVYYSPSRGCYWNKCTFCDYGLNTDSPTSPWRQYTVEKIMEDLRTITVSYKYIYFSVDVLAPSLLLKLARAIIAENLDIRWSAEIRLEEYWSPDKCELLYNSGCIAISVGFESGNQRILNLIDKGTKVDRLQETIQMFSNAGIGVQIMGFTGFPTETIEDALSSTAVLEQIREYWTFGGLGHFILTKGAIVAREPDRFGITGVRPYEGEDIAWRLHYKDQDDLLEHLSRYGSKELTQAKAALTVNHFDRPWVGGVDSPHTMFYHDRYGTDILRIISSTGNPEAAEMSILELNGYILDHVHHLPVNQLFNKKDLQKFHDYYEKSGIAITAQNFSELMERFKSDNSEDQAEQEAQRLFVRRDGTVYPFPEPMIDFLLRFKNGLSLQDLLAHSTQKEFHTKLWHHCIRNRFLRVRTPEPVVVNLAEA